MVRASALCRPFTWQLATRSPQSCCIHRLCLACVLHSLAPGAHVVSTFSTGLYTCCCEPYWHILLHCTSEWYCFLCGSLFGSFDAYFIYAPLQPPVCLWINCCLLQLLLYASALIVAVVVVEVVAVVVIVVVTVVIVAVTVRGSSSSNGMISNSQKSSYCLQWRQPLQENVILRTSCTETTTTWQDKSSASP